LNGTDASSIGAVFFWVRQPLVVLIGGRSPENQIPTIKTNSPPVEMTGGLFD
jgi:hypothetical protein